MKVVILAGGLGTRLSEETELKPKPMVEIGGKPILWHIMKIYSHYGFNDFVILTGYKSHIIKDYFINYYTRYSDITVDMANNTVEVHKNRHEPWKVTMLYTGQDTMTGGRIKKAQDYIGNEPFMLTYGDGVSNVDLDKLVEFHKSHGKIATMTAVNVGQQFGVLEIDEDGTINKFREKSDSDGGVINAGFMVLNPEIFDYIEGDSTVFEKQPLETVAAEGQLKAYMHHGFWKCMDTQRDREKLEEMIASGEAPWMVW